MRKTQRRRKLFGKTRRRRQRGGNRLKALLAVVAAAALAGTSQPVNAETIRSEAATLAATPAVVEDIRAKNPVAAVDEATGTTPMETVSSSILKWVKTIEDADTAIYGGLAGWFTQKAKEIEDTNSLAPLLPDTSNIQASLSDYIPDISGWSPSVPPAPSPASMPKTGYTAEEGFLEPGITYKVTVNDGFEEDYNPPQFARLERIAKDDETGELSYLLNEHPEDKEWPLEWYPMNTVTLTPRGGRRRKTLRRKK